MSYTEMSSGRKLFSPHHRYEKSCNPCEPPKKVVCETTRCVEQEVCNESGGNWWYLFWWWLVIAVVVWLILVLTVPEFVQQCDEDGNPNGEVDQGKAILAAIIIALIVCVLIWLFTGAGYGYGY